MPTLKGAKFSEEHKQNIKKALKGKPKSIDHRKHLSEVRLKKNLKWIPRTGTFHTEETKKKMRLSWKKHGTVWNKDSVNYAEICENISKSLKSNGSTKLEKNPNWQGGKSFEEYGQEFNLELRKRIRERDNFKCQQCWKIESERNRKLVCHHIDYDKKNNTEENIITLCENCHGKTNFNREDWSKYFKEFLRKPKIFVSVLNDGFVRTELVFALTKWMKETEYRVYLEMSSDRPIENNRNKIVKRFLSSDADFLLQIDNDNVPAQNPLQLIDIMKEQNIDILSCPVWLWQEKVVLNVYMLDSEGYWVPLELKENHGLTEVDATGTGVILCSRKVLEAIKKPFERKYDEDGIEELGLDLYFSMKAKNAGFKIYTHFDYISKHYKTIDLSNLVNTDNEK